MFPPLFWALRSFLQPERNFYITVFIMNKAESKQFLADLVTYAEAGRKLPFRFICNWQDYRKYRISRRMFSMIIANLNYAADSIFERYCKGLQNGTADFIDLIVQKSLLKSVEFYKCELLMIEDMIYEYEAYLTCGNMLSALLGKERERYEMYDHREDI